MNKAVLIPQDTEEELLLQLVNDIQDRLQLDSAKRILCIGLKDKMLSKLHQTLVSLALPVRWATDDFSPDGNYIMLADYIESKGLERELVYIIDVDHLAASQGPFVPLEVSRKSASRDRIKLFVALTRAMREVRLYYTNRYHLFIRELLSIEATIQ